MYQGYLFMGRNERMIKKELLDILACPVCKEKVVLDEGDSSLICNKCRLRFPIEDDIPIMLVDRAEKID